MKKIKVIEVITENDEEGRTTKTLGLFTGSVEQAIEYCYNNGLKPYYNYSIKDVELLDVSDLAVKGRVIAGSYNTVKYYSPGEKTEEENYKEVMAKLSDEDKKILGLTK